MITGNSAFRKFAGALSLGVMLAFVSVGAARGQSCQEDFQKLSERRLSQVAVLNKLGKAAKGKMDPVAACPAARRLVSIESEVFAYMEKNKDWCNIPDDAVDGFKEAQAKSRNFAAQACAAAAKVKKMQSEQQAEAGAPTQAQKLPAGPL